MPPKAKLHNKSGKTKSFPKSVQNVEPNPSEASSSTASTSAETSTFDEKTLNFEVEVCWCIQKMKMRLSANDMNPKQAEESTKVLKVLQDNSQPMIRKRQLMHKHFPDYRARMGAELKKGYKALRVAAFTSNTSTNSKSTFLRKSAFLTMEEDACLFKFQPESGEANCSASDLNQTQTSTSVPGNQNKGATAENAKENPSKDTNQENAKEKPTKGAIQESATEHPNKYPNPENLLNFSGNSTFTFNFDVGK